MEVNCQEILPFSPEEGWDKVDGREEEPGRKEKKGI